MDRRALVDTRVQLHWAAQAAAAVGRTRGDPQPDWSHHAFSWSDEAGALLQTPVGGLRAGIRLADLTLLVVGGDARTLALRGRTLADGYRFFDEVFGALTRELEAMPAHAVGEGAPFDPDPAHLAELARLYADADRILAGVGGGPVRCWPHHFDIASLIDRGGGRTIGVGLSPGDTSIPEPYWYVAPWPVPASAPALALGRWHTEGWTGAVLVVSESWGDEERFLHEAVRRLR